MIIYILLIYLILYILYFIKLDHKIPKSLSHTAYLMQNKKFFLYTFWSIGIILLYPLSLINVPLSLLFTLGLLCVGISPWYKQYDKIAHFGGGYLSGITSQILVTLVNPWILLLWIPYIIYAIFTKDNNQTFWSEIVCFVSIFIILL